MNELLNSLTNEQGRLSVNLPTMKIFVSGRFFYTESKHELVLFTNVGNEFIKLNLNVLQFDSMTFDGNNDGNIPTLVIE